MKSVVVILLAVASLGILGCAEEKSSAKPASTTSPAPAQSASASPAASAKAAPAAPANGW